MLPWRLHLKLVPCSKIEASLIPSTTPPPKLDHHETADLGVRDMLRIWKMGNSQPEPETSNKRRMRYKESCGFIESL
jgi:hypothetical protein